MAQEFSRWDIGDRVRYGKFPGVVVGEWMSGKVGERPKFGATVWFEIFASEQNVADDQLVRLPATSQGPIAPEPD